MNTKSNRYGGDTALQSSAFHSLPGSSCSGVDSSILTLHFTKVAAPQRSLARVPTISFFIATRLEARRTQARATQAFSMRRSPSGARSRYVIQYRTLHFPPRGIHFALWARFSPHLYLSCGFLTLSIAMNPRTPTTTPNQAMQRTAGRSVF